MTATYDSIYSITFRVIYLLQRNKKMLRSCIETRRAGGARTAKLVEKAEREEGADLSSFKGSGLLSRFIPFNQVLIPCSPLLIPGILAVVKIRPKTTYEHQCSFHCQCKSDLAEFSP